MASEPTTAQGARNGASGTAMTADERRATAALGLVVALRMFGLFLVLPVLALYARDLPGASALLVGAAVGVYGIAQAGFQIPVGRLSDHWGRKPTITVALVLFAAGSVLAATSEHIYGLIAGRALQGTGAVAAPALALAADLSRDEQRTKVMALLGASIGMAFVAALLLGPVLNTIAGVPGLFWMAAGMAAAAGLALHSFVPAPARQTGAATQALWTTLTRDRLVLGLALGVFALHALLTATFVALPFHLDTSLGDGGTGHWRVYVPVLVASLAIMLPALYLAERRGYVRAVLVAGGGFIAVGELWLAGRAAAGLTEIAMALTVFFGGFNTLEALLPSLVSRRVPAELRGAAMGAYTTAQFLGAFAGGMLGGWALGAGGWRACFLLAGLLALAWLPVAARLPLRDGVAGTYPPGALASGRQGH